MKRKKSEQLFGVPPSELTNRDYFTTYKSAKKGQNSFRVTKSLLDNLIAMSIKINKQPKLIISILNGVDEYILSCTLTKTTGR